MSESSLRRQRAARLPAAERREALVGTAEELLVKYGPAFTTARLAEAAGVAEGTIFRVFPDKDMLLAAVVEEVVDTTAVRAALARAAHEHSLEARLTGAADAIVAHIERVFPVFIGAMASGLGAKGPIAMKRMTAELVTALTEVLARDVGAGRLRGDAETISRIFYGIVFASLQPHLFSGADPLPTATMVGVFLDGARRRSRKETR